MGITPNGSSRLARSADLRLGRCGSSTPKFSGCQRHHAGRARPTLGVRPSQVLAEGEHSRRPDESVLRLQRQRRKRHVNGLGHPYILHGHECLVFFLGGIPVVDSSGNFGVSGFSKDPTNPFSSVISAYGTNRDAARCSSSCPAGCSPIPNDVRQSGVPGYYDTLGGAPGGAIGPRISTPTSAPTATAATTRTTSILPSSMPTIADRSGCSFSVTFPVYSRTTGSTVAGSACPQPVHEHADGTPTVNANGPTVVTYLNATVVPDHLVGDRWALRCRRPVRRRPPRPQRLPPTRCRWTRPTHSPYIQHD